MDANFDRRRCLVLIGSSLAFVSFAYAREDTKPVPEKGPATSDEPESPLAAAARRAKDAGKPLFVMFDHGRARDYLSGDQWAVVLDFSPQATLAELALCELVYASAKEVLATWPQLEPHENARTFALVVRAPSTPKADDGKAPTPGSPPRARPAMPAAVPGPRPPELARLIVATPAPSLELLHDKSRTEELYPWLRDVYLTIHRELAPDDESFLRAARAVIGARAATRSQLEGELASITRARRMRAPDGARWIDPDGEEYLRPGCGGTPCGTASMPRRSRRFLSLLVEKR